MDTPIQYQEILDSIFRDISALPDTGRMPTYIPELSKVDPGKFGIHLQTLDGRAYRVGDSEEKFSIQSISKVFSLSLAFSQLGDDIWLRVGKEPSGSSFNSLVQLEYENGIPRNPLINAGALVIADMLLSLLPHPKTDFLRYVQRLCDRTDIHSDEAVARSEKQTGYRNAALAHFLKSYGNIRNDIDEVLDFYFHQCAIAMSCEELARAFMLFVNGGAIPWSGERVLSGSQTKRLNALMQTCGFYDEAGEFTFKVGLPGKSGVGGGIVAVLPGQFSVGVWSPRLNPKGNSVRGLLALEQLTTRTGYSIF